MLVPWGDPDYLGWRPNVGIPESALIKFNNQYLGKFVGDNIEIGKSRPEENLIGLDAITGATVTVIAQNQVMMLSGG